MFYDKFKLLCNQKGVSCNRAATDMGLSNSTPTKWKKTGATPDAATLSKVSNYFGVPISYLLGDTVDPEDRSRTHWAEVVYKNEKTPTQKGERVEMDDFTYAMQNEAKELTEMDKQILLSMAKQLNDARKQKNGETQ